MATEKNTANNNKENNKNNKERSSKEKEKLVREMTEIFRGCGGNVIGEDVALEGCAGLVMFEEPVFGFSSPDDEIYQKFMEKDVIGPCFMQPGEWLPGAKSIISFFLPFTERVRSSNRGTPEETSPEWLHARIEGQAFLDAYTGRLEEFFRGRGFETCVPATDSRFKVSPSVLPPWNRKVLHIASNWSERHIAYASGLGTFCLTRGLISEKGVAGRYGSVIVTEEIEPDSRPYEGVYDYCIMCGACIKRCPARAISLKHGKNQLRCRLWMKQSEKKYDPRYGCGKCQVGVPCEDRIPRGK